MDEIAWPDGKSFAFTVFDDTDNATVANVGPVYDLLAELGFRTTKSVWPIQGPDTPKIGGATSADLGYRAWTLELQSRGFEIGSHGATYHTSDRALVTASMAAFHDIYGHDPVTLANHSGCGESIYWGEHRISGTARAAYNLMTRYRHKGLFRGHCEGDPLFWGDLCKKHVRYVRNFTYADIDTLSACPQMPYFDRQRPYVNAWFASSEGANVSAFTDLISEANQDRLEERGGACIMYTHFASGFAVDGRLDPGFERLMRRLASKNGWYVPAATLLDHLRDRKGLTELNDADRRRLEFRWLLTGLVEARRERATVVSMTIAARVRALRGGDFRRGVLTLMAGTGSAQILVLATAPILTRIFTPDDYGTFAVASSIVSILIAVTCLRYDQAVLLPDSDETAANVLTLALVVNLIMTLVVCVVLVVFGATVLDAFGIDLAAPYIFLISLGQLGGGLAAALTAWNVRMKSFSTIAATRLTQAGAMVGTQVALGSIGLGAVGLFTGDIVGRITGSVRLARRAWSTHADAFRAVTRSQVAAVARRFRRFPLLATPSSLMNVVALQAPLLFFVVYYGVTAGGAYALADRVCSIPLALIAGAVGFVYFSDAARNTGQRSAVRALFMQTSRSMLVLGIGPAIIAMVLAPILAGPILGADWAQVGTYVAILTPMYLATFVATATGDSLSAVERQDLQVVREVVRLVLLGAAIPLAAAFGLSDIGAIVVLSAAGCMTYIVYWCITWYAIRVHDRRLPSGDVAGLAVDKD